MTDALRDLLDEDGENRALRSFLMQYSCDRAITVGAMLAHMNRSGWRGAAPAFALSVRPETHLTKGGAQVWIRHLLSLEAAQVSDAERLDAARYRWLKAQGFEHGCPRHFGVDPIFRIEFNSPEYGRNPKDSDMDCAIDIAIRSQQSQVSKEGGEG